MTQRERKAAGSFLTQKGIITVDQCGFRKLWLQCRKKLPNSYLVTVLRKENGYDSDRNSTAVKQIER